ncbi:MAG: phosphoribosylaminoimidazolesuccinocarboxamide synthase [Candidatus Heimdallarchaeota archaeon]|nr:phosphoribosylaminoimidazolesuccinocarboxamide synthase [Candidatus Heimdallarchaeota archaeon]
MERYSGKAKDIELLDEKEVKIHFRDSISAFDGEKTEELLNKGEVNCRTSAKLFEILNEYNIETHYLKSISSRDLLCEKVDIIPVEIVCRNIAAGSFCRRYGIEIGTNFDQPLVEFFLKEDELHDPLITEEAAILMNYLSGEDATIIKAVTLAVNHILRNIFKSISLVLVDFKLEFGRSHEGKLIIADEISADTMRLWEINTGEIKDKDRYRKDLGDVIQHYKDILERLETITELPNIEFNTKTNIRISLKDSVLDPAGEVTFRSLKRNEYENIESVRLGKNASIKFSSVPSESLYKKTQEISNRILSNPLIEETKLSMEYFETSNEG